MKIVQGLRVVLFQKLFKGYTFCFLGHSVSQNIFELFARETNLKKKRSVKLAFSKAFWTEVKQRDKKYVV